MKIITTLLLSFLSHHAFAASQPLIIGGGPPPAEFARATAIVVFEPVYSGSGSMVCSAVVISPSYLLTAGHCVEDFSGAEDIKITNAINGREINRTASKSEHPNYRAGFRDSPDVTRIGSDLAVLRLNQPINFPVTSVRIPSAAELGAISVPASSVIVAAGMDEHGRAGTVESLAVRTQWYGSHSPGVLQFIPVRSGTGLCEQDSGGALFYFNGREHLLMGILSSRSAGARCGSAGSSGFAASVSASLGWLNRVLP